MPICLSLCAGQYHPSHQESSAYANLCSSRSSSPPCSSTLLLLLFSVPFQLPFDYCSGRKRLAVECLPQAKNEDGDVVTDVLSGVDENIRLKSLARSTQTSTVVMAA